MKAERNLASLTFVLVMAIEYGLIFLLRNHVEAVNAMTWEINVFASEIMLVIPALLTMGMWYIYQLWRESKDDGYQMPAMSERLMFRRVRFTTLLLTVLFTWAVLPLMTLCNAISMIFVENEVALASGDITNMPFALAVFVIAVYGPMCEEFAFRGVIYGGYRRNCRPLPSVLMSGLLFGLMHLNFNQFGYAFVLGCAMALLVEAAGSIWPSVLLHFIVNFQSVASLFAIDRYLGGIAVNDVGGSIETMYVSIVIYGLISIITTYLAVLLLRKIASNEGRQNPLTMLRYSRHYEGRTIWSVSLVLGIAMALFLMISSL